MIQNAAAQLVFNESKRAHVTPLFVSLHWPPVAARIQFKTPMLAYKTTTGSAPTYFHSLLRIYIPSRCLRSANERRLVVPSQRGSKSLSRTFWFTIPGWWNDLPTPIRNAGSLSIFKQQLKTHLFQHFFSYEKKNISISSSFSLPFFPSLASLYLFEQRLKGVAHRMRRAASRHVAPCLSNSNTLFSMCVRTPAASFGVCPQRPATTQNAVQISAAPQSAIGIVLY